MEVGKFAKKLKGLDQIEVVTGFVSALNKLLVDKGVVTEKELQKYFLDWLKLYKSTKGT